MKKNIKIFASTFFLIISLWFDNSLYAEDKTLVLNSTKKSQRPEAETSLGPKESLMNSAFVLETDQDSAAESLERISGKIDMGFSAPENTYKTEERPGAGPFAKERSEAQKQGNANY